MNAKTHTLPTGTMAEALAPVKEQLAAPTDEELLVTSGTNYFDPADVVANISSADLRLKIADSVIWNIQNGIIANGRRVVGDFWKESADLGTFGTFDDFLQAMQGLENDQEWMEDCGADTAATPIHEMKVLDAILLDWMQIRDSAKDISGIYSAAPKSLDELVKSDRAGAVSSATKQRLETVVRAMADSEDEEEIKKTLELLVTAQGHRNQSALEYRKKTAEATLAVINFVLSTSDTQGEFWDLSTERQAQMINFVRGAVDRAVIDCANTNKVPIFSLAGIAKEAKTVNAQLADALDSPKFRNR